MDVSSMELSWLVDAVVGILVLASAYLAMVRGLVRELFALASWVVAFFAAFFFAPSVQPMLSQLPFAGDYLSECRISMLVAFVLVFGATLIVTGVIIWMFSGSSGESAIGILDQGLGFIYGALRGLVLVAVLYIVYQQIGSDTNELAFVEDAFSIGIVRDIAETVQSALPNEWPDWFKDRVNQLMGECGA